MADEVDFEPEAEDVGAGATEAAGAAAGGKVEEERGRGGGDATMEDDRYGGRGGVFESVDDASGAGAAKSVEGWIIFVTGVHEEAQEDDLLDTFAEYGTVKNINVNLDRRTGFVKGYALVEYEDKKEAEEAIKEMNGKDILGEPVSVDWAFVKPAKGGRGRRRR